MQQPAYEPVTANEMTKATSNFQNWKSPGIDHLQNFWWCHLTCVHEITATIFDNIIQNPEQGRTTLIPKKDDTRNPSNYRPITCLQYHNIPNETPHRFKLTDYTRTKRMHLHNVWDDRPTQHQQNHQEGGGGSEELKKHLNSLDQL